MRVPRSTIARRLALPLLTSSSLLAVMPAAAQENTAPAAARADNVIIVTAQKREQDLQDVPLAITAIGEAALDQLQVNELRDAVKFLPSVTIQSSGPGFSQIYFRGVSSGENANHSASLPTVGTYLDEMPVTTIQGALDIHAYDLNRIEALAGPQGTLYGASSMAGTLRMITNQPDTTGSYGAVDLELNRVSHGGTGGVAEGFVNLPISDNIALRAVAWYRHDAGYIDNIAGSRTYASSGITHDNTALVENDYNDVDTYGARLALGIELNDSWTLRPTVMGQRTEANGIFAQERSTAVTDDLQVVQYNPEYSEDEWIQAALTIEGKIGNWDLVATGGHLWRHDEVAQDYSDYAYFYDALYGYGAYWYDNNGDLINPNQYIIGRDDYRRWFGEVRASSPAENRLRVIAGLFAQRQSHLIEQNYIIDGITDDFTVPGTESNIWLTKQRRVDRDYAAFGELSFDITDQLTATGGIRVYNYKNSLIGFFGFAEGYSGDKDDPMGTPGVIVRDGTGVAGCGILDGPVRPPVVDGSPCTNLDKTTSDTDFIHKLNLTYEINPDVMVYATWSRGFRPGGINRRGTLDPYRPDELDNYELGWKTMLGPVRFNGSVYQQDWNGIQLSFLGANGLTEIRNAGIARIRGAEADIGYSQGGITFNLNGSYNDAQIRRDFCQLAIAADPFDCTLTGPDSLVDDDLLPEPNAVLAAAGTRLPLAAKFKGNAIARYQFAINDTWDAHVQGTVSHVGRRRSDLRDQQNAIKGEFPAYTTADFSFGLKGPRYRVEFYVANMFDSRGKYFAGVQCVETTCGDPDGVSNTGGAFYDYVIKPRTVGVKVGADF
jgi:outer membrane receptor protein involved in Fe transport